MIQLNDTVIFVVAYIEVVRFASTHLNNANYYFCQRLLLQPLE
jgi:hypothetical protein